MSKASSAAIAQLLAGMAANYAVKKVANRRGITKTTMKKFAKGRKRYTKPRAAGNSIVMTKRKKSVVQNMSTENRTVALKVPAKNPSAYALAMACLEPQYFRVQGLTQYDTNYGYYPLANRITSTGVVGLPIHIWDITSCPNNTGTTVTNPQAGYGLGFATTGTNANTTSYSLARILPDGTQGGTSEWEAESTSENPLVDGSQVLPHRKQFHEFTQVKANLYGVRRRATRYLVQLMMIKDTSADFINAADTNTNKKKLFDYLSRPFVYNNLNIGDPSVYSDIRVLKSFETIIDPIDTESGIGGVDSVPKIVTLNWFIKHNRMRRYDWRRGDTPDHVQNAAWDSETDVGHDVRVDPRFRVYLVIRALDPDRRTLAAGETLGGVAADPIAEPSYDLVLRNKFLVPV